ncbi:hypothetical protein D3C76_1485370 [compost metagenome]
MLRILIAAAIADAQVLTIQVIDRHADAVIFDLDPLIVRSYANLHTRCIRVPCISHRFGQDSGDVAVKVDAKML